MKVTKRLGQSQLLWIMDNSWFYIQLLWMVDDLQFTSFLTEFQSYQDDRRMIIKGLYNWIPFTVERFRSLMGFEPKTATIRGPAPNLPCKIIASHKTLTYQIKKYLFKERKLFFQIEEDGCPQTRNQLILIRYTIMETRWARKQI